MLLYKKVADLQRYLEKQKAQGLSIGFVPTMGALHQGHLSLINRSNEQRDLTVCSIFVNPTQFNEAADLEKYPRTPEKDIDLLISTNCQILFMPSASEVYPESSIHETPPFNFGYLDKPMEGAHRPGHFQGMAQVVHRLLDIVKPHALYMGQKDFQQFSIVQEMLRQMDSEIELVMCPIIREEDGLAMSSRNKLLTAEQRRIAPNIFRTLTMAKSKLHSHFPAAIRKEAIKMLTIPGMIPEYFEIVDGYSLKPVEIFEDSPFAVACTAVRVGKVRLIDNMVFKKE